MHGTGIADYGNIALMPTDGMSPSKTEQVGYRAGLTELFYVEEERPVEPEVGSEALDKFRRCSLSQHRRCRVAGDDAGEDEYEQGHAQEHRDEAQQTADEIGAQAKLLGDLVGSRAWLCGWRCNIQ